MPLGKVSNVLLCPLVVIRKLKKTRGLAFVQFRPGVAPNKAGAGLGDKSASLVFAWNWPIPKVVSGAQSSGKHNLIGCIYW